MESPADLGPLDATPNHPLVDVVVPVHNEARVLAGSITRLIAYLEDRFPFSWRITIAENGSSDDTAAIATQIAEELPGVYAIHVGEAGRGRAVRTAWAESPSAVVAYMDVDLSTDLDAFLPLVAPLVSGHSEVAVGSRLAPGARVNRGPVREILSRCYNVLVRAVLRPSVRDAQCGFKALRADAARALLPVVRDDNWFFDTELLVVARRSGFRVVEIPVRWTDDVDSRVELVPTMLDDLRGIWRITWSRPTAPRPEVRR